MFSNLQHGCLKPSICFYFCNNIGVVSNGQPWTSLRSQLQHQPNTLCSTNCPACSCSPHFVCLKDWDSHKLMSIINSAINLKYKYCNTHGTKLNVLSSFKVMLLEDHNEPLERIALSKAISFLGADEVHITKQILWDHAYYSRVFSEMADIIFVSSEMHGCLRDFSNHSMVPVIVMRSRRHASVQAMATIMSIIEDYGTLQNLNLAYVGWPHPIINDYLLVCPLLGANFVFKCSCPVCPVSPLMLDEGKCKCEETHTVVKQFTDTRATLKNATIIISGPAAKNKDKVPEFVISVKDIQCATGPYWTYYHTLPRGPEVADDLFWNPRSRSFNAFKNMQYICAALLMYGIKCKTF